MDRRAFLGGLAAVGTALSGCTSVLGSNVPEYDVGMRASAFVPAVYEASVGDTIVWYNGNDRAHTVTAYADRIPSSAEYFASGGFESEAAARDGYMNSLAGSIYPGQRYEYTVEVPGEYRYFCVPHESAGMVGVIDVTE